MLAVLRMLTSLLKTAAKGGTEAGIKIVSKNALYVGLTV
jgi:hypothetical protein